MPRTRESSSSGANGFWMKGAVSGSRLRARTSSPVYPDMKRIGSCGNRSREGVAQLAPVEPGHDHVGEHQRGRLATEREDLERLPAVLRLDHDQADTLERAPDQAPHRDLVLHHQHEALLQHALGRGHGLAVRRVRELRLAGRPGR